MVRELYVKENPEDDRPSWEQQCEFYYDLAIEGVPLPDDFRDLLHDDYRHLSVVPPTRVPEVERAWANYLAWAGDIVEDPRTPRERLEAYFLKQEQEL